MVKDLSFYNQVMAFRPHPKAAEGIDYRKPVRLEKLPKVNFKNLIRVVLETEVGDREEQRRSFYERYLKTLNRSELTRLMRKIHMLAAAMIDPEDKKQFMMMEKLAEETIATVLAESLKLTDELHKRILKQLKKFSGLLIVGKNQVSYSKKKFTLHGFVKEHFSDIAEEYDSLVEQGVLIPEHREKQGISFIKHAIQGSFT